MISITKSTQYQKARDKFVIKNPQKGEALIKTQKLFVTNPKDPSLNLEKLKGTDIWTIRIDRSNRIFLMWLDKTTALFIDIGSHDKYRQY
jgi:hypothetical protein